MNEIDYMILSSTIDYSTDLVCCRLAEAGEKYYRLNRDEFSKHRITVDMQNKALDLSIDGESYRAQFDCVKGIYYRSPVFLRVQSKGVMSVQEQLERSQWSSFLRNLIFFENATWINHPVNTYRAENKIYQLRIAEECGLAIPMTYISNNADIPIESDREYIVKSLDSALFYDGGKEMFTYSCAVTGTELKEYELASAPVVIQEFLDPKIDCRVTYVKGKMFPVKILHDGKGLRGDWRMRKTELEYRSFELPECVENAIGRLMNRLGLNFGGIDLAYYDGKYYFIEVNPTGEWGWLEANLGIGISCAIKDALVGERQCSQ